MFWFTNHSIVLRDSGKPSFRVFPGLLTGVLLLWFVGGVSTALADDAKPAMTAGNPTIALDSLKAWVKPMTTEELGVEATAWMQLLKAKATEISDTELFTDRKNEEIDKVAALTEAVKEAEEKAKSAVTPEEQTAAKQALEAAQLALKNAESDRAARSRQRGSAAGQTNEQRAEAKEQALQKMTVLREEQTALADRLHVVLDSMEAKGGDVGSYQKYLDAVTRLTVDVTDQSAFWITVKGWLLSKEGGLRWAANLAKFLVILGFFWGLSRAASRLANQALSAIPKLSGLMREFLIKIIHHGTLIIGVLVALTALEVSLGPLLALLGGISFVLAFALQNNLANFASGLMLLFYKPFDVGDEVKFAGLWGWVDSITLANTKLKGFAGELIIVPNSTVWGDIVTNLTSAELRKISIPIHINHEEDMARCKQLLVEAVASHPDVLKTPEPSAFIWTVADHYVEILAAGWTRTPGFWTVYEEVFCLIQAKLKEKGIGFALPKQEVTIKSLSP